MNTSESPKLVDTGRGFCVSYLCRELYDSNDPIGRSVIRAHAIPLLENTLYLLASPLLGYGLDVLFKKLPVSSKIITIECDAALAMLSLKNSVPVHAFDSTESIITIASFIFEQLSYSERRNLKYVKGLSLNGGRTLHANIYQQLENGVLQSIRLWWRNRATIQVLGRRWLRNILSNLSTLPFNNVLPEQLPGSSPTRPLLVCGAGPSLEYLFSSTIVIQDHCTVLAVDTALPALQAIGLIPDYVVALEAQWHNLSDFTGRLTPRTTVLADLSSHSPTLRKLASETTLLCFSSLFEKLNFWEWLKKNTGIPLVPAMGSVGVLALWIAITHWNGPVYLSGLDFQEKTAATHAKATPMHLYGLSHWSKHNPHHWLKRGFSTQKTEVLEGYANLARSCAVLGKGRVFDIRQTGLDLGVPKLEIPAFLGKIREANNECTLPQNLPNSTFNSGAATLISQLSALLENISLLCDSVLSGKTTPKPETYEQLHQLMEKADIAWIDFPDPTWPPIQLEAILRVQIRCQELRSILVGSL